METTVNSEQYTRDLGCRVSANRRMHAILQRHKRDSDANHGASGNHYCPSALPSAYPGTSVSQNGGAMPDNNENIYILTKATLL